MPEITGSLRTTLCFWQQGVNREWETAITRQKSGLPQLPGKLNLIFSRVTMGLVWKQKPEHQGPGKSTTQVENSPCCSPERKGRIGSQDASGHIGMEASSTEQSTQSINPATAVPGHSSWCTCAQGDTGKTAPHRHNHHSFRPQTNCLWSGAFVLCFTWSLVLHTEQSHFIPWKPRYS